MMEHCQQQAALAYFPSVWSLSSDRDDEDKHEDCEATDWSREPSYLSYHLYIDFNPPLSLFSGFPQNHHVYDNHVPYVSPKC